MKQTGETVLPDLIDFADAEVKRICVENWDTDGDGELSKAEAAAVTTLKKDNGNGTYGNFVFRDADITSFDELQYFTGLTKLENYTFNGSCCANTIFNVHKNFSVKTVRKVKLCASLTLSPIITVLFSLLSAVFPRQPP